MTALLNKILKSEGQPRVNHKLIYRIMKEQNLVWQAPITKPVRTHNGKVMVPESYRRYCSDTFEIWCWDYKIVRVAFVLDYCDREVINWLCTTAGIDGQMIRDLMTESLEARFGKVSRFPREVQFLSDNGSIYRANKTREFAKSIGFEPCTTPTYSPESNGMVESKLLKGITFG